MDVVPYVTKVYTKLAKQKPGNWTVYSRTALGHYSVASSEIVYLYGFNLGNDSTKPTYNNTPLDNPVSGRIKNDNYPYGENYASYQVLKFPVSNVNTSGEINISVNGVSSLNNLNKNEASGNSNKSISNIYGETSVNDKLLYAYNLQPNSDNNNLLTDDIEFDVWQINSNAGQPISGGISDLVMKINPVSKMLGFAFVNGSLDFSMAGKVDNVEYSYYQWQGSYDQYASIGLSYDSLGYTYGTATGTDLNAHQADVFNFLTSRWGKGKLGKGGSVADQNNLRMENIGQKLDTDNDGVKEDSDEIYFDKKRIQSPSIATSVSGNNTNVYLAYYDNINDEIRFRAGTLSTTAKQTNGTLTDDFTGNELNQSGNGATRANYGYYDTNRSQIIATATGNGVLGCAGNYLSLGVVKESNKDVLVMVWYDQHNKKLCYAYNKNPLTKATGVNMNNWTKGNDIFDEGGMYCQLAIDANNGIHIACYDNGNIKYAYLDRYDSTPKTCTVDSYDIIGQNLTIDVAGETMNGKTYYVPHIGYYALSRTLPKYAYLANPIYFYGENEIVNGSDTDNDSFTGIWESSYIPTTSEVPQDRINVGIFKTNGLRANSETGASSSGKYNGKCYGNGTNNSVLAYSIKVTSSEAKIETAQMK